MKKLLAIATFALIPALGACKSSTPYEPTEEISSVDVPQAAQGTFETQGEGRTLS